MCKQISEKIFIDDQEYCFSEVPLAKYLEKIGKPDFFEKGFVRKDGQILVHSSTCWRGYVCTWKINGNELYLIGIKGYSSQGGNVDVSSFFPHMDKVKADWYTGKLKVFTGAILRYDFYEDIYEKDLIFEIQNGNVIKKDIIDNRVQAINLN
jgi:hypothetical protein